MINIKLFKDSSEYDVFRGDKWIAYIDDDVFCTRQGKSIFTSKEAIVIAMKQSIGREMKLRYQYFTDETDPVVQKLKKLSNDRERNTYLSSVVKDTFEYAISNGIITFKKL